MRRVIIEYANQLSGARSRRRLPANPLNGAANGSPA
jgi:hypothetical protein